jgi:hypothetical protein
VSLFCLYRNVLGSSANAAVYERAVAFQEVFEQSRVSRRGVDIQTRASKVVYDDRLGDVAELLEDAVRERVADAVDKLGIEPFDISAFEIQMTSHNEGDFFGSHTDNASRDTAGRALTFVYYFHAEPPRFSGGELVFVDREGQETVLSPGNDTLVLFDPRTVHEVRRISCPSGHFEDGRFTLNGWLHRPMPLSRRDSFFDQRIFTGVGSWAGLPPPRRFARGMRGSADTGWHVEPGKQADHAIALLRLYGDLHRTSAHPDAVDIRPEIPGEEFLEQYYSCNRPVLVPGFLGRSEALRTWSPEYFATAYGDVDVEITDGRDRSPDYEERFRETLRTVTLKELAERLSSTVQSNDFYLVARNNFFENPRLRSLRDDLDPPEDIISDSDRRPGAAKLWLGPEGTVTPLHYDEHSIMFTQVYGTKHFRLIPAFDLDYVYRRDVYYSEVDPDDVDERRHPLFARASVMDVTVEPGDGLFIPAGWWHWAKSRSVSISATFSSFAWGWVNTRISRTLGTS